MIRNWMSLLLALAMVFSLCACGGDESGENSGSQDPDAVIDEPETPEKTDGPIEIAEHIQKAMDANNALTGTNCFLVEDGSVIWVDIDERKSSPDYLMVYANTPNAKKIVSSAGRYNYFLLTEEGDLYYDRDIIAKGVLDICDNVEWYVMGAERCILAKEDGLYTLIGLIDHYPESCWEQELFAGEYDASRIRISGDHNDFLILDAQGQIRLDLYKNTPADTYDDLDFLQWEDLVLIDLAKNIADRDENPTSLTIAGLQADGTVLACGDYAEEILSWGKLSYLSMSHQAIVGLLPDGTLKMTGEMAEYLAEEVENWTNIVGVEVGVSGTVITAVDADGNFYYLRGGSQGVQDFRVISLDGADQVGTIYRYCPDGSIYFTRDGEWKKVGG